ncbi:MAG: DUF222 domain-containing protein [Gemmatimonadota bacterium]
MIHAAFDVPCYGTVRVAWRVRETASPVPGRAPEVRVPGPMAASVPDTPDPSAPAPDPFEDADALEALEEEIAVLAAHIHAATHRLLELVAEFDRRRGWELGGHRSCAHWLAFRTGIDLGTAREKVRAARALASLPATSAAMRRGELSFSAVRALTRVATPATEGNLLELARGATTAELERMVRGWRLGSRADELERERKRHDARCFSVFLDADGTCVVQGRLAPEVGALLMRALEAAGDALFREKGPPGIERTSGNVSPETSREAAARRRADALALVAERALAAGFGGTEVRPGDEARPEDLPEDVSAETSPAREGRLRVPVSGSRAERYQVLLHVDAATLAADGGHGRSELGDGTRVSAETSRRLGCDAAVVAVGHGPDGSVLDVGRRTRTVPPALRRALEARDGGCRFPGCGLRFTDAHHVRHWADGGETALGNLLLLCAHHHRLVHEGGWKVAWWAGGRPAFTDPRGQVHASGRGRPATHLPRDPVGALVGQARRRGADPDGHTAGARWKREADIPDEVWFRAMEAVTAAGG